MRAESIFEVRFAPSLHLFFRLKGFNMTIKSLQVVIAMDKACNVMEEQYRVEEKKAFEELRKQAVDVPEMSLDEINEEIKMLREERKYIL